LQFNIHADASLFNKYFVTVNIVIFLIFSSYLFIKVKNTYWGIEYTHQLDFFFFAIFLLIAVLNIFVISRIINNYKIHFLVYFILCFLILISYDKILPEMWCDAYGDVQTAGKLSKYGSSIFLEEYHNQTLHELESVPYTKRKLQKYYSVIPFRDYKEISNSILAKQYHPWPHNRTPHHPPLWFLVLGYWQNIFGDSDTSYKILIKIIVLIYFVSLFLLLRSLSIDLKLALFALTVILLTPAILIASEFPKNDLLLGIGTNFLVLIIIKNQSEQINYWDMLTGLLLTLIICTKLTGLIIILPLVIYYLVKYKLGSSTKLLIVISIPVLLFTMVYIVYDYDVLLNIITGRAFQDSEIMKFYISNIIINRILYGQFRLGIPLIMLLLFALYYVLRSYFDGNKKVVGELIFIIFYFSIFFVLWGSAISRHQIGFVAFYIPALVYCINRDVIARRILLHSATFLVAYDIVLLVYAYYKFNYRVICDDYIYIGFF